VRASAPPVAPISGVTVPEADHAGELPPTAWSPQKQLGTIYQEGAPRTVVVKHRRFLPDAKAVEKPLEAWPVTSSQVDLGDELAAQLGITRDDAFRWNNPMVDWGLNTTGFERIPDEKPLADVSVVRRESAAAAEAAAAAIAARSDQTLAVVESGGQHVVMPLGLERGIHARTFGLTPTSAPFAFQPAEGVRVLSLHQGTNRVALSAEHPVAMIADLGRDYQEAVDLLARVLR
jgi:hypothetical protein